MSHSSDSAGSTSSVVRGFGDRRNRVQFVLEALIDSAVTGFGDRRNRVQFVLEARLVLSHGLGIGVTGFSLCWKHF